MTKWIESDQVAIITDLDQMKYSALITDLKNFSSTLRINILHVEEHIKLWKNNWLETDPITDNDIDHILNLDWRADIWKSHKRFILLFEFFNFSTLTLIQQYMKKIKEHIHSQKMTNQKDIYCIVLAKNSDINYDADIKNAGHRRLWSVKPFQKLVEDINFRYIWPTTIMLEANTTQALKEAVSSALIMKQKIIIRKKHKNFYTEKVYYE